MKRQNEHADWALLPLGHFPKRADILLGADIELASSFIKFLLGGFALLLVLLPVFVLTLLVAIPSALAIPTLFEGIALLAARRTHLGRGPITGVLLGGVLVTSIFGRTFFSFFAER